MRGFWSAEFTELYRMARNEQKDAKKIDLTFKGSCRIRKDFFFERNIFLVSLIKNENHSKIYIIIMDNGKNSLRIKGNLKCQ